MLPSVVEKATDPQRIAIPLRAAAYNALGRNATAPSPGPKEREAWISGLLEAEGLDTSKDEVYLVDCVALTIDINVMEHFISSSDYFKQLDQAAAQYRTQKGVG
jgi:hypothetical protein